MTAAETSLAPIVDSNAGTIEIAKSRQVQEVQAMMIVAKKFPRDEVAAFARIMKACQRKSLAEVACYEYARGGSKITGPSIGLATAIAGAWGNLDYGVVELERTDEESTAMAYCWDMETNTRQVKIFHVPHIRYSREKGNTKLFDPRDIYENIANNGARRLRACILGIVPGDVTDAATAECERTLSGGFKEPLTDRVRKMVTMFAEVGVSQAEIERLVQHNADSCTERDLVRLGRIFNSMRDGMSSKEEWFQKPDIAEPKAKTPAPDAAPATEKPAAPAATEKPAKDSLTAPAKKRNLVPTPPPQEDPPDDPSETEDNLRMTDTESTLENKVEDTTETVNMLARIRAKRGLKFFEGACKVVGIDPAGWKDSTADELGKLIDTLSE